MLVALCLISLQRTWALPFSETFDQKILDNTIEPKHVHETIATCSEGVVTWKRPYGAIRVTFTLASTFSHAIKTCFKARSYYTIVKMYLEENDRKYNLRTLYTLDKGETMRREICICSDLGSVTLYIETLSDIDTMVYGQMQLDYDIKRSGCSKESQKHNYTEECRPCTDQELLESVCSSDFVVIGKMKRVLHQPDLGETEIWVSGDNIIRDRHDMYVCMYKLYCRFKI